MLILAGPVSAAQTGQVHTVEVSPEVYYYNYEEPGVMELDGVFYGVKTAYELHQQVYARAELRGAFGQVDYSSPVSGTMDNIDDWVIEPRIEGGYDIVEVDKLRLTPFFGFGYRYLNDDSSGKSTNTGARGYERESNYYYSPLGLTAVFEPNANWAFGATAEYDFFWKGKQKSHLSDAVAGLSDVENDQDNGNGIRGSLSIVRKGKTYDVGIEGFVRYWDIDDSDMQPVSFQGQLIGLGYEPANETVEAGGSIYLRF